MHELFTTRTLRVFPYICMVDNDNNKMLPVYSEGIEEGRSFGLQAPVFIYIPLSQQDINLIVEDSSEFPNQHHHHHRHHRRRTPVEVNTIIEDFP